MATTTKSGAKGASKSKTGKMENSEFHEFFVDELKDIYWAEKHLSKALPKMQKSATSPELAAAFGKHTQETKQHIATLGQAFQLLDEKAQAKKCDAMEGLVQEAGSIIEDTNSGTLIWHFSSVCANMGHNEVAELFQRTLDNEKATDVALTDAVENL